MHMNVTLAGGSDRCFRISKLVGELECTLLHHQLDRIYLFSSSFPKSYKHVPPASANDILAARAFKQ